MGIVDPRGKSLNTKNTENTKNTKIDNVLFRWIILLLLSISAKVLYKDEIMDIYKLVQESAGHSTIVDGFHSELIRLKTQIKGGKNE